MAWNRQYRPATLAQLQIGSVRQQLETIVASGKLPQVFLFAGPKGTGKTSSARILALLVNDPDNAEIFIGNKQAAYKSPDITTTEAQKILQGQSFIVQELDAASNRGIDDIRSLKERLNMPPLPGHVTVVILDEVHMLTTEAYNALLKILEEPPAYCLFILATTEVHKIPDTIISRCQLIQFRQATDEELIASVEQILKKEKVTYDPLALQSVVQQARGSFRDAIKLAEMISLQGEINLETASQFSNTHLDTQVKQLLEAVIAKEPARIIATFQQLRTVQVDQESFSAALFATLHQAVIQHYQQQPASVPGAVAQYLLKQLIPVPITHPFIPFLPLEMQLLEIVTKAKQQTGTPTKPSVTTGSNSSRSRGSNTANTTVGSETTVTVTSPVTAAKQSVIASTTTPLNTSNLDLGPAHSTGSDTVPTIGTPPTVSAVGHNQRAVSTIEQPGSASKICDNWNSVIEGVATQNPTVSALLQSAIPMIDEQGSLVIQVFYPFHQEQLKQHKFSQVIQKVVTELAGGEVKLTFAVIKKPEGHSAENELLAAASQLLT